MEKSRSMRDWDKRASRQSEITNPDLVHQGGTKEDFGEFLSDTLSLSKKITGTLMDKFDKGIDIKVILNREEYQKYIEQFKQNRTNPDNADTSARYKPLYKDDSLV